MVKFTSTLFVFATLALSVFASPIEQRDVKRVEEDLRKVAHDVSALNGMISSIGNTLSVQQALAIKSSVVNVEDGIEQTTRDVKEVHNVSESEAKSIMTEVENFIPAIVNALKNLETKKQAFLSIPIKGVIFLFRQLLQELHAHSIALADALIAAAPADLKGQATRDKETVEAAFREVIDFFAHD